LTGTKAAIAERQKFSALLKNAPRWPDMNLAALAERSFSISKSLILFQATPARPAWADAGFRR